METAISAGIIGFGGMGQRHYAAYEQMGIKVQAICDYDPDKVRTMLPDLPSSCVYSEPEALLEEVDLDVVSIATNSPSHAALVIASARAGIKRILCEKPMATNLREARAMVDECHELGVRLAVNHVARWLSNQRELKRRISEGAIGDLRHMYFHCGSVGLANQGTHVFDKMRYLSGSEPQSVIGFIDQTGTPNVRGSQFEDPGGFGIVLFENGTRGFVDTSEDTGVPYVLQLVGTFGQAYVNELQNIWRLSARSEEDRAAPLTRYVLPLEEIPFETKDHFDIVELTKRALTELLGDGPISCTGEDGMKALEVTLAFHVSHDEGNRKIDLPLDNKYADKTVNFA